MIYTKESGVIEHETQTLTPSASELFARAPLEVHLRRDATRIRIYSDNLDEAALIELAETLEPAPTRQPPVSDR